MRIVAIRLAGRALSRFLSAAAVRLALGASFTTPHPAIAAQPTAAAQVVQVAPVTVPAGHPDDDSDTPQPCERQATAPGVGCVGVGWG